MRIWRGFDCCAVSKTLNNNPRPNRISIFLSCSVLLRVLVSYVPMSHVSDDVSVRNISSVPGFVLGSIFTELKSE